MSNQNNDQNNENLVKALQLRKQALELLHEAGQLDGLKAYALPNYAPMDSPVFLLWTNTVPNEAIAGRVYDAREDEIERGVRAFSLADICGVSDVSRFKDDRQDD